MMVTVILHGYLKKLWDGPAPTFEVKSAAEAIRAFCQQTKALQPSLGRPRHRVRAVGYDDAGDLYAPLKSNEIHLIPQFSGGKDSSALVQIAIGAVLVVASFYMPAGYAALANFMFSAGATMMLGGVVGLLMPQPARLNADNNRDPEASKYLGAGSNTTKAGTRISIVYGRMKVYGHVLSFNVDAKDVSIG